MFKTHKQIGIAIIVLILIGIGYVLYAQTSDKNQKELNSDQSLQPSAENQTGTDSATAKDVETKPKPAEPVTKESRGTFSDEYDITNVDVQVFEIVYDGTQFLPNTLDVKSGDIVIFKNQSSKSFWPASGSHPTHTDYPEFDAKGSIAAGENFDFKFIKPGSWKFHDHLNQEATGVIVVTK